MTNDFRNNSLCGHHKMKIPYRPETDLDLPDQKNDLNSLIGFSTK